MTGVDQPRGNWPADVLIGLGVYLVTAMPVATGLAVATTPRLLANNENPPPLAVCCCYYDGSHYATVVADGYEYGPDHGSNVAFFPAHPLAGWVVAGATGWSARAALVVAANVAFAAALVVLAAYLRARNPGEPLATRLAVLGLIGFWPVGFFFRMGYSEGVFLLVLALVLLGLARRWPAVVLAVLAGAATATRPVGLAATAAVVCAVLSDPARGPLRRRLLTAGWVGLVGCWGLAAYAAYLQFRFDNFLAFVQTQEHWAFHEPGPGDIPSKWLRLLLLEPIWNAHVPGSSRHWARFEATGTVVLGLHFWNSVLFALAAAAVAVGRFRRWLTGPEAVLGAALLLIPYLTRADETSMLSHARFASVVVPAFVVLGRGLAQLPPWVGWAVFGCMSPLLAVSTTLFAAGWPLC